MDVYYSLYKVSPQYNKSTFSQECWTNVICNKKVVLHITTIWRWSEFNISICDKEKKNLLISKNIVLNDYDFQFINTTDCCEKYSVIKNIETFNNKEKNIIYNCIYQQNIDDEILHDDDTLEYDYNWTLDDTIYEIQRGFILEPIT